MTTAKKKVSAAGAGKSKDGSPGDGPPQDKPQENKPNFEQSLAELERLVTHMEQGEPTLEETLENFELGIRLSKICQQAIDEAEQRVRILVDKEGNFEAEPFSPGPFNPGSFNPDIS